MTQLELDFSDAHCEHCHKRFRFGGLQWCIQCFNKLYPPDFTHARFDEEERFAQYPFPKYGNYRQGDDR